MADDDKPRGGDAMMAMLDLIELLFVLGLDKGLIGYPELQLALAARKQAAIAKGHPGATRVFHEVEQHLEGIARERGLRSVAPEGQA